MSMIPIILTCPLLLKFEDDFKLMLSSCLLLLQDSDGNVYLGSGLLPSRETDDIEGYDKCTRRIERRDI